MPAILFEQIKIILHMNKSHRTKSYNVCLVSKVGAMSFMFSDVILIICVNKCGQSHCLSYYQPRMKRKHHEAICANPFSDWGWENYPDRQNTKTGYCVLEFVLHPLPGISISSCKKYIWKYSKNTFQVCVVFSINLNFSLFCENVGVMPLRRNGGGLEQKQEGSAETIFIQASRRPVLMYLYSCIKTLGQYKRF